MKVTAKMLKKKWLEFYSSRGHAIISSASLLPDNDPTVLFTTAGMHPLVPYLLGEPHPSGKRLCNAQKCVRTGDIDEVGDSSHCTFFEMLGNWSLGDYFKTEQIKWSYEFLTSSKYLGLDKRNLAVSVFAGDSDCPRDEESASIWQSCGIPKEHIFYLPKKNNWWGPAGTSGPCGPDTEMFIDTGKAACSPECSPACDCGKYLEIWNDVFMQYYKDDKGNYSPLKQKNVDTGMGLERTIAILQGVSSVYETDLFAPIIKAIEQNCQAKYGKSDEQTKAIRIIADHIRTATFIIGDDKGVTCSNVDAGYILRRLVRRAIRYSKKLEMADGWITNIASVVTDNYHEDYPELLRNKERIMTELAQEEARFDVALTNGLKEFNKQIGYLTGDTISGKLAFRLYDTFGFPLEMTVELAREKNLKVNVEDYNNRFREHQQLSSRGAENKFKGGLADSSEATSRLHTATHLMHAALKKVLKDESVNQRGSNITAERLRFDFNFARPLTEQEIQDIEQLVNAAIEAKADIICSEMTVEEAKKKGAVGLFESKYGEKVKVYSMGKFSTEICGGPHAANTGELGKFKIVKEQSSSSGVRRIKATLS